MLCSDRSSVWHALQVRDIFANALAQATPKREPVWGWLEPRSASLPHVLLQGNEVVLGRGMKAESSSTDSPSADSPSHGPTPSSSTSTKSIAG